MLTSQYLDDFFDSCSVRHVYATYLTRSISKATPEERLIHFLFAKTARRIVQNIKNEDGCVSQNSIKHALFSHRNAEDHNVDGGSPSECIYGHNLEQHVRLDPLKHKYVNFNLKLVLDFTN